MADELLDDTSDDGDALFRLKVADEENVHGSPAVDFCSVTRDELLILVRHWAEEILDVDLFAFFYAQSEWRTKSYAYGRIAHFEALLGEGAVRDEIEAAAAPARERIGEEYWRIFTQGAEGEWAGVQDEVHQELVYLGAKVDDGATCQAAFAFLRDHPTEVFFDLSGDLWYLVEPPRSWEHSPGRLWMKVRMKRGASRFVKGYDIARPPGWVVPYGFG